MLNVRVEYGADGSLAEGKIRLECGDTSWVGFLDGLRLKKVKELVAIYSKIEELQLEQELRLKQKAEREKGQISTIGLTIEKSPSHLGHIVRYGSAILKVFVGENSYEKAEAYCNSRMKMLYDAAKQESPW